MSARNTGFSSIPVATGGLLQKIFSLSQRRNIVTDDSKIVDIDIDAIIKQALKTYQDASFNHVDISGELMTKNIHVEQCLTFY